MPDIALDLRFLHYAILVARLGSFSAAAESLDLSHTTVNRRVSLLERRLGFQLFERDATGAHLTPAGARFCSSLILLQALMGSPSKIGLVYCHD